MKPRFILSAAIGAVLAVHAVLITVNLHMDGDTLRDMRQLSLANNISDSLIHRGKFTGLYVAQSPVLWTLNRVARVVVPRWNMLTTTRLAAIVSMVLIAGMLAAAVRLAGGGVLLQAMAVLFPFCWHGFSFLIAECDDNVTTNPLRLAVVLALLFFARAVPPSPLFPLPPQGGRGRWVRGIGIGLLLGLAVSWHFQSVLLIPAAVAVFWIVDRGASATARLRHVALLLMATLGVYALCLAISIGAGLLYVTSLAELAAQLVQHHRGDSGYWVLTAGRSLPDHFALIQEGWGRMVLGYGWLRPAGLAGALVLAGVAVPVVPAFVYSFVALKRSPAAVVFAAVLGIQIVHSILYEPESIERWDVPVMLSGLLGAMAILELRRREAGKALRRLVLLWGISAVVLVTLNGWGYWRFATRAEPMFLEVAQGTRKIQQLEVDTIGAHYRLCKAARKFSRVIGDDDGFLGLMMDSFQPWRLEFWIINNLTSYLMVYEPEFYKWNDPQGYGLSLFHPPPARQGMEVAAQEGFIFLLRSRRL